MAAQVQQKRDFAGYRLRAVPPNTRESPSRRQRPLPPCVENRCFEDLAGSDEDVADIASEASEYLRITESRGTVASADQRFSMFCFLQNFINQDYIFRTASEPVGKRLFGILEQRFSLIFFWSSSHKGTRYVAGLAQAIHGVASDTHWKREDVQIASRYQSHAGPEGGHVQFENGLLRDHLLWLACVPHWRGLASGPFASEEGRSPEGPPAELVHPIFGQSHEGAFTIRACLGGGHPR